jgi:hypothetical protein
MASATHSGLESKAESSVRVQEEDGHLQLCLFNVLSSIGYRVRSPQDLGNYCSDAQHTTVKHPGVLVGRADDERTAVWLRTVRGKDGIALQDVFEVPLSRLGTKATGYIPVHQKL